ncbi:hypothetical protein LSAT2_003099 [Lamellibrachia satsuma]|nr:hypothetical protein LSAT2_003099 [Lamellibrachia satsuma]
MRDWTSDIWSGLHYLLDSVVPLLQVFFNKCYQANHVEFPKEADYTDTLANSLVEFTRHVGPLVSNATHVKTLVSCMNVIMSVSTLPVEVMQEFEQQYGNGSLQDIRGDARKKYDEYYAQEQELNEQLNTFATNFSMVNGGANTVRAQIGYPSNKEYTELGGDEDLPLGAEFQEHMHCFVDRHAKTPEEQYRQANKLIKQLAISTSMAGQVEKDRLDQETLDIKSLQLLRGLVHNEIVKLPENWQPGVSTTCVQLKQVEYVQNALNHYEAVVHVLPHLAMNSDSLVRESLAFIVTMLYGGNRVVQKSCSTYFLGTREEKFFFAIKNRMLMTIMATKEKRSLQANHQQKVEEAVEQAKTLRKAVRDGHMATEDMESKELVEQSLDKEEMDYHDDGYIELVLRMMGSMCDGQNTILQDYLREQPDNIKSVNLIAETTQFLNLIYGSVNNKNIILITELFNTLVEFTSGNNENKLVVFDHKVCDYINCILRRGHFHQCDDHEILALKQSIATLIVALTEEDFSIAGLGAKEIGETIDGDTVWQTAKECYQRVNCDEGQKLSKDKELVKETEDLGYRFYHILCRLRQIDTTDRNSLDRLLKTSEDRDVWDHYDEGTLSIEIVKDDNIQKIHFRCKDKSVLREDVKEKFKYAVDRSSASNKLRDLMDWSKDITQDISYTRRMLKNPLAGFFVKYWWHFNIGMIFMSFVFFVLTMATWRSPSDLTSLVPVFVYPDIVRICMWVLGGIHNACAMCALISFFITNHPTLPRLKPLRRLCQYVKSYRDVDSRDGDQVEDRTSNLEVKFFSFKTFWYLVSIPTVKATNCDMLSL